MENTFFFVIKMHVYFFQIDLTFEFHQDGACGVKYLYNTRNNFIILLLLLFFKNLFSNTLPSILHLHFDFHTGYIIK